MGYLLSVLSGLGSARAAEPGHEGGVPLQRDAGRNRVPDVDMKSGDPAWTDLFRARAFESARVSVVVHDCGTSQRLGGSARSTAG